MAGLAGTRLAPFFGFGRPYMPGQRWTSGFFYAPQLGWRSAAMSYAAFRMQDAVRKLLRLDPPAGPALAVPVSWNTPGHPEDGVLLCRPPAPHRLKRLAGAASAILLGAGGS